MNKIDKERSKDGGQAGIRKDGDACGGRRPLRQGDGGKNVIFDIVTGKE